MSFTTIAITLVVIGFLFIVIEAFIPGFGVFGFLGIISTFVGLVLGVMYVENFWIVIVITIIAFGVFIKFFKFPKTLVLEDKSEKENEADMEYLVGKEGVVVSVLKPVGKCLIDENYFECYSVQGIINKDKKVVVKEIKDNKIMVKEV